MRKVKTTITLSEEILDGFKSRGLTNLSGVIEELLADFLSSLPPGYKRRTAKETRELVRGFIANRHYQERLLQQFFQLLIASFQTLSQSSQPQQGTTKENLPQPNSKKAHKITKEN
jgi:hypothetical protein